MADIKMTTGSGAHVRQLGESRWHFQHGPIDLIIDLHGDPAVASESIARGFGNFRQLLPVMAGCLRELRSPVAQIDQVALLSNLAGHRLALRVVGLMLAAANRYPEWFVTPMIAVAGSVAQAITEVLEQPGLERIVVNNGGDISLSLDDGQIWRAAIADGQGRDQALPRILVPAGSGIRGVATSGWRGRSFSFGIADAVTVLADHASNADAAATLIANATDIDSPAVERLPANQLDPQSDLGQRPVTTNVKQLKAPEVRAALRAGRTFADQLLERRFIRAYRIALSGEFVSGPVSSPFNLSADRPDLRMPAGMSECSA